MPDKLISYPKLWILPKNMDSNLANKFKLAAMAVRRFAHSFQPKVYLLC